MLERNSVLLNETSNSKWQQLLVDQPMLAGCISCGACTAVCPRAGTHNMGVRKVLIRIQRAQQLGMEPADCLMCNKCALVCPRNLNTRMVWFFLELLDSQK